MLRRLRIGLPCVSLAVTLGARPVRPATYEVGSMAELQSRLDRAAGDTIILREGVYTTTDAINITRPGTAAAAIRIQARSMSGVRMAGAHGFTVTSPAAYIEIVGVGNLD